MSHQIIIRGGNYSETNPPEAGEASVEIIYAPSHDLTPEQQGDNVAKLVKLANKIYAIEGEHED